LGKGVPAKGTLKKFFLCCGKSKGVPAKGTLKKVLLLWEEQRRSCKRNSEKS
jgi:hypothetical protein